MSQRLSERALPDFSQLIDGDAQLALAQRDAGGGRQKLVFEAAGVWPRLYVGRLRLRTLAQAGHDGHLAAFLHGVSSRLARTVSGEGGAP